MVTAVPSDDRPPSIAAIHAALEQVVDPEIPTLSIRAIGILRDVRISDDGLTEVVITPTYSGCPAIDVITHEIKRVLAELCVTDVRVATSFNPPWTTDWIGDDAREIMKANGIAPPVGTVAAQEAFQVDFVSCPLCGSRQVELVSSFGSTSCKAQYRCRNCREPFAYFKNF